LTAGDNREELQAEASGVPELVKARRGFSVLYKGKTLLSTIDPAAQAERAALALPVLERTLYLCPSPLLGYGLGVLLSRLGEGSALLCLESDEVLFRLSHNEIDPALFGDRRLRFVNIKEGGELCAFVRETWGARRFRRVQAARLGGGWRITPELYDSLENTLRREIALDWGNALTLAKLGRRYIRNALRNLSLIPRFPSASALSFGRAPVLVLGAGPSLDGLLEGLERRFGSGLGKPEERPFKIVCVDTCLPALRERGIDPDLAVILESQHWNLRDFIGSPGWKIPAAMDLSALPATGRILASGLFLFMTAWTELRLFERLKAAGLLPAGMPPLGSVGLCAMELARRLGQGTIIAGGIDFSFTLDNYHARSTPGHRAKLAGQNRFTGLFNADAAFGAGFSAVSKSGLLVRSNPAMRGYRALFEQEFAADPRIFDIAGSGLPLGLKTLPPEEAFDTLAGGSASPGGRVLGASGASGADVPLSAIKAAVPPPPKQIELEARLGTFIEGEKERLKLLRNMLAGTAAAGDLSRRLGTLIDECDYLWAHFPDYAGAGGRRPGDSELAARSPAAISFLKRLRIEIDPALSLLEAVLSGL
jgi:hypothetical protein